MSLGTSRWLFKPFVKLTKFHSVLDRRIPRQDANREVLADVFDPAALADGLQPKRKRFVKRFGSDLGAVLNPFGIADRDAAGADRLLRD